MKQRPLSVGKARFLQRAQRKFEIVLVVQTQSYVYPKTIP
jgi:hypothetical protein